MTRVNAEVYEALIEAGASQEKARRAAEAVANLKRFDAAVTGNKYRWAEPLLPVAIVGAALLITYFFGRC